MRLKPRREPDLFERPRDNQGENGATIWMRMPLRGCRREGVARPCVPGMGTGLEVKVLRGARW